MVYLSETFIDSDAHELLESIKNKCELILKDALDIAYKEYPENLINDIEILRKIIHPYTKEICVVTGKIEKYNKTFNKNKARKQGFKFEKGTGYIKGYLVVYETQLMDVFGCYDINTWYEDTYGYKTVVDTDSLKDKDNLIHFLFCEYPELYNIVNKIKINIKEQ